MTVSTDRYKVDCFNFIMEAGNGRQARIMNGSLWSSF